MAEHFEDFEQVAVERIMSDFRSLPGWRYTSDGSIREITKAWVRTVVEALGLHHVGWYYYYEPADEYHWSSNVAEPPSWDGVSDVQPMLALSLSGSGEAQR